MNLINKLYHNRIISSIIHTTVHELCKELKECESVLDLGCGHSSPLQYCKNVKYSVGVEIHTPYLKESKKKKIHNKYLNKKVQGLKFKENSFDAVILIEVLEHLSKKDGLILLKKAEKWAKKKVIISTPNGYFPMGTVDNNKFQKHLSGWTMKEFKRLNYECHGLAGAKFFHTNKNVNIDSEGIFHNIRFKSKKLFYFINGLSQVLTYYLPMLSFELLAVKKVSGEKR